MVDNQTRKTLRELKKLFKETFKSIDKQTIQRERKIFSNQILYTVLVMINKNCGYQEAVLDLNIKKVFDSEVSYQAINNTVLSGKFSEQFGWLNDQIIEKFFVGKTSRRILE